MFKRMTKEERIQRANEEDRIVMEKTLAEVSALRNAGYTARIGWVDHSGYTGITVQVRCDNDAISQCGEWVQPLFPLPGATTCQKCYADGMEQAGV